MTVDEEGKQIRSEVGKLRADKRRRYPEELRRRILEWVRRGTDTGMLESDCGKAIGVKTWRLRMWQQGEQGPMKTEPESKSLALIPIEAPVMMSTSSGLTLVAPSGHRVEGLTVEQVGALLRELT